MRLEPARADWPALAALHAACFPDRDAAWSAEALRDFAASPGATLFVDAPPPRGFALLRVAADEAELVTIAVAPQNRRRGCGAALLAELIADARAQSAARLFAEVAEDNLAARALYARAGFAEIGRRRRYYRRADAERIDALLLRLPLAVRPDSAATE